jgi:glycerol-3-phosphate cytidylyltransferase
MTDQGGAAEHIARTQKVLEARMEAYACASARALIHDHIDPDYKIRSMSEFFIALVGALKAAGKGQIYATSTVVTFGTFDVFHYGHLRLLQRAAQFGDRLVVGVSTDDLSMTKKGRKPIYSEQHRKAIVASLACVSEVFDERSLNAKASYLRKYNAATLVMGSDWAGAFDRIAARCGCKVIYLERTPGVSSTQLIEIIDAGHEPRRPTHRRQVSRRA